MPRYTFTGMPTTGLGETTVTAPDEQEARRLAMQERWGDPAPLTQPIPGVKPERHLVIADPYRGQGLDLIRVEDRIP